MHQRQTEQSAVESSRNNKRFALAPRADAYWSVERGASPIIGTAIHNGHATRADVTAQMALDEAGRLREEDPFTEYAIRDLANRIVFHRSRFEIDLNRGRDGAVYLTPEQAWGLDVWASAPPAAMVEASLRVHDAYYAMLEQTLTGLADEFGQFVLLDIHSYNHRRKGPEAEASDPEGAPEINIGSFSMDRQRWAHVVDPFIESISSFSFRGRTLDVRENVAFDGKGEQTRFVHSRFPETGCAIAIEFKKFFMDEWTGEPDIEALEAMRQLIAASVPVLEASLRAGR